jgi:predicted SAM-dependent methyltransferase
LRCLDIGPGYDNRRIEGFETLDISKRDNVDYVADASERLPFENDTFDIIHASHILEHIDWKKSESTIAEWVRILKPGGQLEVWVPDALKIARAFVEAEAGSYQLIKLNASALNNKYSQGDVCRWFNGRIFSFTDTHRALFSRRYLVKLFRDAGLINVTSLSKSNIRSKHHGFVEMGIIGYKANGR